MGKPVFIGDNTPEDVRWLHSLSDSELDFLISLKDVAFQRAKVIGHQSLANKFDLKTLRALSYVLMQHVKSQINDLQLTGVDKLKEILDGCNLLKLDLEGNNQNLGNDRISSLEEMEKERRRGVNRSNTTMTPVKKMKRNDKVNSERPKVAKVKQNAKERHYLKGICKTSIIGGGGSGGGAVASVVTQIKMLIHHKCLRVVATIVGVSEGGDGVRVVVLVDVYLPEVVWWNDWQFPRCGTTAASLFGHLRCYWAERDLILKDGYFNNTVGDESLRNLPDCHVVGCKQHSSVSESEKVTCCFPA